MLDVGISELALITLAALIFIGPKDFPVVIRYMRGVLHQLRDFRDGVKHQVDQLVEESGLNEMKTTTIIDLNGQPQIAYDVSEFRDSSFVIRNSSLEKKEFESRITNHES